MKKFSPVDKSRGAIDVEGNWKIVFGKKLFLNISENVREKKKKRKLLATS